MPDKMPLRTTVIPCKEMYEGWGVNIRTNVPFGIYMDILAEMGNVEVTNGQEVAKHMHELLELVVIEWDVKDEKGEPLAVSMDGFKKLPSDLLLFLVNEAQKAINKVPLLPSGDLPNSASQTGKAGKRRKAT